MLVLVDDMTEAERTKVSHVNFKSTYTQYLFDSTMMITCRLLFVTQVRGQI